MDTNLVLVNIIATKHCANKRSALLDLFFKNVSEKVITWENLPNITPKREAISLRLIAEGMKRINQFFILRNFMNVNYANMNKELMANNKIYSAFSFYDPNTIAEQIKISLNTVVHSDIKEDYPILRKEKEMMTDKAYMMRTQTVLSGDIKDFRAAKNFANTAKRTAYNDCKSHMKINMEDNRKKWQFIDSFDDNKESFPVSIFHEGNKIIT